MWTDWVREKMAVITWSPLLANHGYGNERDLPKSPQVVVLFSQSDSGRSETLMMKTGQLNRTLPSVFSPVSHFRVYCEYSFRCCDVTVVKQFQNTFKTPTHKAVSKHILFTSTFTTQFGCVSLFSGSQQKQFWISSIKLPVQFESRT